MNFRSPIAPARAIYFFYAAIWSGLFMYSSILYLLVSQFWAFESLVIGFACVWALLSSFDLRTLQHMTTRSNVSTTATTLMTIEVTRIVLSLGVYDIVIEEYLVISVASKSTRCKSSAKDLTKTVAAAPKTYCPISGCTTIGTKTAST